MRDGRVADLDDDNPYVRRRSAASSSVVGTEPRVTATTIQTVGSKGYDGFTLAVVTE